MMSIKWFSTGVQLLWNQLIRFLCVNLAED